MESTAKLRRWVLVGLAAGALASSLWAMWPWPTGDWKGLALNFGTELIGAVVTYLLLELIIGRRGGALQCWPWPATRRER